MNPFAVRIEDLWKEYRLGATPRRYDTLREALLRAAARPWRRAPTERAARESNMFWALRELNLEIAAGEVVGVVGRNGAGKSTLLKILSRITAPTRGQVQVRGRVASLLEIGTGFHPELTGRENIFLNGAILGMARRDLAARFDEIVQFAEVEKFLDTPVKQYSSGMYMRLAFAVAAHMEPDILLVDEVLAVGDVAFQRRCLGKMGEVARSGRTVLFVSHNIPAIRALCTSACLLEGGRLRHHGGVDEVIALYSAESGEQADRWMRPAASSAALYFSEIAASVAGRQPHLELKVELALASSASHRPAFIALDIADDTGSVIMQATPVEGGFIESGRTPGKLVVKVQLPPLIPGRYSVSPWVGPHNTETYDMIRQAVWFSVDEAPRADRSFPYHRDHGWIVPLSSVEAVKEPA